MKIYGSKIKQIKKGVHFLPHGGEVRIGRNKYSYTLPAGSVVIPNKNVIYTKSFKGAFEWRYLSQKDFWIVTQIGGNETNFTHINPNNLPDRCLFMMVVDVQEENRVHIFIPSKDGDTITEWRYFSDFFTGIIRNSDIT